MTIHDRWREAIACIADRNEDAARLVCEERNRVEQAILNPTDSSHGPDSFDAKIALDTVVHHPPEDRDLLTDAVCALIWGKLRQQWAGGGDDPFLGITELTTHLSSRVPARYTQAEVDDFAREFCGGYKIGDLRGWLCKSRKNHRRYAQRALDASLRDWDIEEKRRREPAFDEVPDFRLMEGLARQMPRYLLNLSWILSYQLVNGSCDCPKSFATAETLFRGYRKAERRCRKAHLLTRTNLSLFLRESSRRGKNKNELDFLERAATGACTVYQYRGFAASMLCNIFDTPGLGKLRLAKFTNAEGRTVYVLVEVGVHDSPGNIPDTPDRFTAASSLCLGCPECLSFVGPRHSRRKCVDGGHVWMVGSLPILGDLQGESYEVKINACPAGHIWPTGAVPICPVDQFVALATDKRVDVLYPTNRDLDGIAWKWSLKAHQRRSPPASEGPD